MLIYGFGFLVWCLAWVSELVQPAVSGQAKAPFIVVLGTVQDGGSPHLGCARDCCKDLTPSQRAVRKVVSLGLADPQASRSWLFEATPDITDQVAMLHRETPFREAFLPDGILLSHAHIGHYTGLLYLGREAAGAHALPVYVMPRMQGFLENNEPWKRLLEQGHIRLAPMADRQDISLSPRLTVRPLIVPHRDELSETVCFVISGPRSKALFLPDIDKWDRWDTDVDSLIRTVDYAFLDATFSDGEELKTRDLSRIPHPFVVETMSRLDRLPPAERSKVYFIHFNHTNPLLDPLSSFTRLVSDKGYRIARIGQKFEL